MPRVNLKQPNRLKRLQAVQNAAIQRTVSVAGIEKRDAWNRKKDGRLRSKFFYITKSGRELTRQRENEIFRRAVFQTCRSFGIHNLATRNNVFNLLVTIPRARSSSQLELGEALRLLRFQLLLKITPKTLRSPLREWYYKEIKEVMDKQAEIEKPLGKIIGSDITEHFLNEVSRNITQYRSAYLRRTTRPLSIKQEKRDVKSER